MRHESIILTREIISHIMGNMGFVTNSNFGSYGLSQDNFIIDKKISISDSSDEKLENKKDYNIWGGLCKFNNSTFRVLFTDLTSDDNIIDYFLTLRVDQGPIHAMNLSNYKDEDSNYLLIFDNDFKEKISKENDRVKIPDVLEASTYDKCMALAGIETINQIGVDWTEIDDYNDLYKALNKIIEG